MLLPLSLLFGVAVVRGGFAYQILLKQIPRKVNKKEQKPLNKLSWRISCHQCRMYLKQTKKKNAPFCQRSRGRYTHVDVEVAVAGGGKVDIETGGQESGTLFEERKVVQ